MQETASYHAMYGRGHLALLAVSEQPCPSRVLELLSRWVIHGASYAGAPSLCDYWVTRASRPRSKEGELCLWSHSVSAIYTGQELKFDLYTYRLAPGYVPGRLTVSL
jgi:hypothetical protein